MRAMLKVANATRTCIQDFLTINGGYQPVVPMSPGVWQRWRLVYTGARGVPLGAAEPRCRPGPGRRGACGGLLLSAVSMAVMQLGGGVLRSHSHLHSQPRASTPRCHSLQCMCHEGTQLALLSRPSPLQCSLHALCGPDVDHPRGRASALRAAAAGQGRSVPAAGWLT